MLHILILVGLHEVEDLADVSALGLDEKAGQPALVEKPHVQHRLQGNPQPGSMGSSASELAGLLQVCQILSW